MITTAKAVAAELAERHYLGPCKRGKFAWRDAYGVVVFAAPASRHLPRDWLELSRWCLSGEANAGSRQWSLIADYLRTGSEVTTVVSYSDPAAGHSGSLYRACGWLWAPVWHRLRPPPTGCGSWNGGQTIQGVKDRWVYCLRPDERRPQLLTPNDSAIMRRHPWMRWQEPRTRRGLCVRGTGGCDRARWIATVGPFEAAR